ncbi:MAG: type II 3-dehydroquinate dehydratase [Bacteroidia bacterium]|nr:type II 3-dehydroquinate dehydratase [Bacteroidia bacterium]
MRILILNGPNLNLLGTREPQVYGNTTFEVFLFTLKTTYPNVDFTYVQTNVEGELINALHNAINSVDAVLINPGGYSHTSVSIADAISAISIPVLEIHISNIHAREDYRHNTVTGSKCIGVISGLGLKGYALGVEYLLNLES